MLTIVFFFAVWIALNIKIYSFYLKSDPNCAKKYESIKKIACTLCSPGNISDSGIAYFLHYRCSHKYEWSHQLEIRRLKLWVQLFTHLGREGFLILFFYSYFTLWNHILLPKRPYLCDLISRKNIVPIKMRPLVLKLLFGFYDAISISQLCQ